MGGTALVGELYFFIMGYFELDEVRKCLGRLGSGQFEVGEVRKCPEKDWIGTF